MRAFVAIPCPPRLGAALAEALDAWRRTDAAVRWSAPEQIHLTLRFLGDRAERDGLDRLEAGLRRAAAASGPLAVRPGGTGAFPGWTRPRVLWLGLEDEGALATLARAVEETAREAGFPAEDRPFSPHLTLGRVKAARRLDEIVGAVRSWAPGTGEERIEELVLYRSELGRGGARHHPLARWRLGGGAP